MWKITYFHLGLNIRKDITHPIEIAKFILGAKPKVMLFTSKAAAKDYAAKHIVGKQDIQYEKV